jgi:hypothetical protein
MDNENKLGIESSVSFQKLNKDEVLVYDWDTQSNHDLNLYVGGKKEGSMNYRKIGTWKNVMEWDGFQFSSNQRKLFFVVNSNIDYFENVEVRYHLYFADGDRGRCSYIMDVFPNFKTSVDGKIMIYEDYYTNYDSKTEKIFYVYDMEKKKNMKKFVWVMSANTMGWENIAGFNIIRKGNYEFYIFYPGEAGYILAAAKVSLKDWGFSELWNFKLPEGSNIFPNISSTEWQDDVLSQHNDVRYRKK